MNSHELNETPARKADEQILKEEVSGYVSLHDEALRVFTPVWSEAYQNARLRRTKHFSPEEEADIKSQDRIPYSIPIVEPRVNSMISQQMLGRSEWRVLGRQKEDEIGAEVMTQVLKVIDEQNNFQYIESDIYADGMVKKVGVVKRTYEESEDGQSKDVKLTRKQFDQIMWDLNCKDYEVPLKAKWMQEWEFLTKDELKKMYPEKEDEIESTGDTSIYTNQFQQDKPYYNWNNYWYVKDGGNKLVKVVTHYQRKFETLYDHIYEESDTGELYSDLGSSNPTGEYDMPYTNAFDQQEVKRVIPISTRKTLKEYIVATVFFKDSKLPLDQYRIDSKIMPLHPFFPQFDDGYYWGVYDQVKWAQIWIDRISTQIDYSIGSLLKNSYEIEWSRLHEDDKARWIQLDDNGMNIGLSKQATKGGAMIRRMGSTRIIDAIQQHNVPPDLFNVWQYMMKVVEDNLGGRNIVGLKESSNESGVAVQHRQEAALQSAYIYIDNLKRWKKLVGEGIVEMVKEAYTEPKVLRILGNEMSPRVLKLLIQSGIAEQTQSNQSMFFLKYTPQAELKYDLIVDRAEYSPLGKQRRFVMLQTYNNLRVQSGKPPLPFAVIGKYIPDMDMTVYDEIVEFEKSEEAQMQQQQEIAKQKMLFEGNLKQAKELREGASDATDVISKLTEMRNNQANNLS